MNKMTALVKKFVSSSALKGFLAVVLVALVVSLVSVVNDLFMAKDRLAQLERQGEALAPTVNYDWSRARVVSQPANANEPSPLLAQNK